MKDKTDISTAGIFEKIAYAWENGNTAALPVLASRLVDEAFAHSRLGRDERVVYSDAILTTAEALYQRGFTLDAVNLLSDAIELPEPAGMDHASMINNLAAYADDAALVDQRTVVQALIKAIRWRQTNADATSGYYHSMSKAAEKCHQIIGRMSDPRLAEDALQVLGHSMNGAGMSGNERYREAIATRPNLLRKLDYMKGKLDIYL